MKELRKTFEVITEASTNASFTIPGPGLSGVLRISAKSTSGILANYMSQLKSELVPTIGSPQPIGDFSGGDSDGTFNAEFYTDSGNIVVDLNNPSGESVAWVVQYEVLTFQGIVLS